MPSTRPFGPFALALALALLLGGGTTALAQDDEGTPEVEAIEVDAASTPDDATRGADGEGYNALGDPLVGTEVHYLEEDGDEIAVATVVEVVDPFEDFSEFFDVDEDSRFVAVEVRVESTGDELDVEPFDFGLQTVDGFFYGYGFVSREAGEGDDRPDLESTEVEEGDEVSGLIFFEVPEESELARLIWQPESGRLLVLADLRE